MPVSSFTKDGGLFGADIFFCENIGYENDNPPENAWSCAPGLGVHGRWQCSSIISNMMQNEMAIRVWQTEEKH